MEKQIEQTDQPTQAELAKQIADLRIVLDAYASREQEYRLDALQRADKRRGEVRMEELSKQFRSME